MNGPMFEQTETARMLEGASCHRAHVLRHSQGQLSIGLIVRVSDLEWQLTQPQRQPVDRPSSHPAINARQITPRYRNSH